MKTFRPRQQRPSRAAFTLLELLIVLAIIVSLAAMVAPNLLSSQQDAKISTTRATIRTIEDAVKRKASKMGGTFEQGGAEIIEALAQPYEDQMGRQQAPVMEENKTDEWGNPFQYAYDPNSDIKPRIWSFGPDGQDNGGSGDDVSNIVNNDK